MPVLPDLSPSERSVAHRLLTGDESVADAIHSKLRDRLSIKSVRTLKRAKWLNDEVINTYLSLLQAKSPDIFIFSSFFWSKLNSGRESYNFQGVKSWTRRRGVDVFLRSLLLFPINLNENHWVIAVADFRDLTISVFDSSVREYRDFHAHIVAVLSRYLQDEFADLHGESEKKFPTLRWVPCSPGLPQQLNDNDCGVFVCLFSVFLVAGRIPDFAESQEIRTMRARIAVAFCTGTV